MEAYMVNDVEVVAFVDPHCRVLGEPVLGQDGVIDAAVRGPLRTGDQAWRRVDRLARRVSDVESAVVVEWSGVGTWVAGGWVPSAESWRRQVSIIIDRD
jgi:hypothetical protein